MLTVELPCLPIVPALDGTTFESVLFCRFVSLAGNKRRLSQSQRQVSSMFNRSGRKAIGKYLRTAQDKGFLRKIHESTGVDPDEYVRGDFFDRDTQEGRALITLSSSLWGKGGLLRGWPYPTAWGHGCVPPAVILILATLLVLDESITRKSLKRYLAPLVKESSFNNAIQFARQNHLIFAESGRFIIAPDWEHKIRTILDEKPACNARQVIGDRRRRAESEKNRMRLAKSDLTNSERRRILTLPCVMRGCSRRARELEHFPPKRFLRELDISTNRHFVWAICWKHNHQMQAFIKKLPDSREISQSEFWLAPSADPLRLYHAAASYWIARFYQAYAVSDIRTATRAVQVTLALWKASSKAQALHRHSTKSFSSEILRRKGKNSYIPTMSQLPISYPKLSE